MQTYFSAVRHLSVRAAIDIVTTVAMLVVAGVLLWASLRPPAADSPRLARPMLPNEPVPFASSPTFGSDRAPLIVVQFANFQCSECADFANRIWPSFRQKWIDSSRAQMVFKHLTVTSSPDLDPVTRAAGCAAAQDKFWPMHDLLFRHGSTFTDQDLRHYAGAAALDLIKFDRCRHLEGAHVLVSDTQLGRSLGLRVAPTFLVGLRTDSGSVRVTSILEGIPPEEVFESAFRVATSRHR